MTRSERVRALAAIDLYPVIGPPLPPGRSSLDVLDAVLDAGVRIVQLRDKTITTRERYHLALEFRRRTEVAGCLFFVNDQVDLALAAGADGVHLGQDDLPLAAARALAPDLLFGRSTHSLEQALEEEAAGADTVNLGPLYPTGTKPEHTEFLGTGPLPEALARLRIPLTVMGGINESNIDEVVAAGARRIALVSALTMAPDPRAAAHALRARITTATGG